MKGLLNNLGFGAPCEVDLEFEGATGAPLRHATIKDRSGSSKELPLYSGGDGICGKVTVRPTSAKKVEHAGMKVQLLGQIELASDRHRPQDFVALVRELSAPGELYQTETMNFEFSNVEMQYDAYYGSQVKLRCACLAWPRLLLHMVPSPCAGLRVYRQTHWVPFGRALSHSHAEPHAGR